MNDDLYVIGEIARRTGLPVRTIRFYADEGIVPPAAQSRAGYRLFDLTHLTASISSGPCVTSGCRWPRSARSCSRKRRWPR